MQESTGTLSDSTLQGGGTVILTINSESASYTHEYMISFGTGMETLWTQIEAGETEAEILIPDTWAEEIPDSTETAGGILSLRTYSEGTLIGTTQITDLTYTIPEGSEPVIGTISTAILRTIGETTYANIGEIYTQGHCGTEVTVGTCSGQYGADIAEIRIKIDGYEGMDYDQTFAAETAVMDSGLLTESGETQILIMVTDSRGLTSEAEESITVTPYAAPTITGFRCWRVNSEGEPDDTGEYAKYAYTFDWSRIGSNEAHTEIEAQEETETDPAAIGWILPENQMTFDRMEASEIILRAEDAFESAETAFLLESGWQILHISPDGKSVAVGHAVCMTAGEGYRGTLEIDSGMEIWYGGKTLEERIRKIVAEMSAE